MIIPIDDQVRAILGAQFKATLNRFTGGGAKTGRALYSISLALWYGLMCALGWLAATLLPEVKPLETLVTVLASIFLLATLFWQLIPVMLATTGLSLDLRRLMVYPVAPRKLFLIEALLRVSTGVEVLIVLAGAFAGVLRNPLVPGWCAAFFAPFIAFNLLLSAGIKDLLARLLARRGARELVILSIVLLSALPQLLVVLLPPDTWRVTFARYSGKMPAIPLPWNTMAMLCAGQFTFLAVGGAAGWLAAASWFGYSQFTRGLRWDAGEARSRDRAAQKPALASLMEHLYRLPSRLLPDPLGALIEKEVRFLSRAPRFRLVFFMGFTFGLVIWLPLTMGRGGRTPGVFSENVLVWVSVYAALLLGDVLFWNSLGFDRTAAQAYYVMPVRLRTVLVAKNCTAVAMLLAEVSIVTAAVLLLRVRFPLAKVPEAYVVTLLLSLFLLAMGNMASVYAPRAVDPGQSWRNAAGGKTQALMALMYPVLAIPIGLAYLARYAFETEAAFYGVLLSAFVVGAMAYWVSLESAADAADKRREELLAALSRGGGPIS